MQLNCIHCGRPFAITTEQLGGRGRCPHCHREIQLPSAAAHGESVADSPPSPDRWWENSVAGLTSMVFHMALFIVLALVRFTHGSGAGMSEEVLIGELPTVVLSPHQEEQLSTEAPSATQAETLEQLEVEAPIQPATTTSQDPLEQFAVVTPSTAGGSAGTFDLGSVSIGGGSMSGGSWEGMLQNLRRNGLDIVITFDSTGSMGGEIRSVERQIHRIGSTLLKLIPKARIGLCTYRDEGDDYVVKGLPLTSDITAIDTYLRAIEADAGGDEPEAVHRGLEWVIKNNAFRSQARKVILLFGDAPPHYQHLSTCLRIASDFSRQQKGVVSTVTCRSGVRLPEFVRIAEAGGGEAFLTSDERQIVTQLLVLVFGSSHRDKVLEAFKLMER
ncbi:MAG: hypothetical protein AB7F89_27515 [Pirellulaceae bacterium]